MKKITLILCLCVAISAYAQNIVRCGTVTDYDGNEYQTVKIGTQCWMAENLRTTHYADGTEIPMGRSDPSYEIPYRYCSNGDERNVQTYGYLYNWSAVMGGMASSNSVPSNVQGICPKGWHVPSFEEYMLLIDFVATQPQYQYEDDHGKLNQSVAKALAATTGWNKWSVKNTPGYDSHFNNTTGFSALPVGSVGYNSFNGSFEDAEIPGLSANFWSTTEKSSNYAYGMAIFTDVKIVLKKNSYTFKRNALSVRCIRGSGELDIEELALRLRALKERKDRISQNAENTLSSWGLFFSKPADYSNPFLYPYLYPELVGAPSTSTSSSSSSNSEYTVYEPIGTATGIKITESGSYSSISAPVEKDKITGTPHIVISGEHYQLVLNKQTTDNGVSVTQYSYFCHVTHGSRILYTVYVNF